MFAIMTFSSNCSFSRVVLEFRGLSFCVNSGKKEELINFTVNTKLEALGRNIGSVFTLLH